MSKKCVKCGYVRQTSDTAPWYECPKCGVIYAKAEAATAAAKIAAVAAAMESSGSEAELEAAKAEARTAEHQLAEAEAAAEAAARARAPTTSTASNPSVGKIFCPMCGSRNLGGVEHCGGCGAKIAGLARSTRSTTTTGAQSGFLTDQHRVGSTPRRLNATGKLGEQMTFATSIATCFAKYFDFEGRASRPEYWWFYLFTVLVGWGAILVDPLGLVQMLVALATLFPSIAAGSRRLHDTDRSGWWQLIGLTIIGIIPLVVWLASEGSEHSNQYGRPV